MDFFNEKFGCNLIFKQDGASCHTSKYCKPILKSLFCKKIELSTEEKIKLIPPVKIPPKKNTKTTAKQYAKLKNDYKIELDRYNTFKASTEEKESSINAKQNMFMLNWPANSPDLNAIELLWAHIEKQLELFRPKIKTLEQLMKKVLYLWNRIPKILIRRITKRFKYMTRLVLKH